MDDKLEALEKEEEKIKKLVTGTQKVLEWLCEINYTGLYLDFAHQRLVEAFVWAKLAKDNIVDEIKNRKKATKEIMENH